MYSENDYLMWLSCNIFLDADKMNFLLDYFESAKNLWNAKQSEIENAMTITEKALNALINTRTSKLMEKRLKILENKKIKFIGVSENDYPERLKEIHKPPIGLYVMGELPDFNAPSVAIVGTRRCSSYGINVAEKISKELAENNVLVISGMAEGIDSAAHRGALNGNGRTVAVFGNGVDICYPASNRTLKEKIVNNGCVISEYPPGTKPIAFHFPARNRIMSGLSDAVVVVEAKKRSGTAITANHALEQGKDVFAVPGNITSANSFGTNELIKQGAYVLTETNDILNVLGIEPAENNKINNKKIILSLATDEKLVYDCISLEPISVDELVLKTKIELSSLQYILTMLEIKGIIKKISGQKYILT